MEKTAQTNQDGKSKIDLYTEELAKELKSVMDNFDKKVSDEMGEDFHAGILPFLRQGPNGSFKPDAKVLIVPVKKVEDGNKEIVGGEDSGEAERAEDTEPSQA